MRRHLLSQERRKGEIPPRAFVIGISKSSIRIASKVLWMLRPHQLFTPIPRLSLARLLSAIIADSSSFRLPRAHTSAGQPSTGTVRRCSRDGICSTARRRSRQDQKPPRGQHVPEGSPDVEPSADRYRKGRARGRTADGDADVESRIHRFAMCGRAGTVQSGRRARSGVAERGQGCAVGARGKVERGKGGASNRSQGCSRACCGSPDTWSCTCYSWTCCPCNTRSCDSL